MLVPAVLAQISDVAVSVWKHFLKEVRVIVVDALLTELLVVYRRRMHSIPMVSYSTSDVRLILVCSCLKRCVTLSQRVVILTVGCRIDLKAKRLFWVHYLHYIWEPGFEQKVVLLLDKLFSTEDRLVPLKRTLRCQALSYRPIYALRRSCVNRSEASTDQKIFILAV